MSSRKNVLEPVHIVQAQSMASNVTSTPTNIQFLDNVGVQFNYSGTPTGSFFIDVCNDYQAASGGTVLNPGTWTSLPFNPAPTVAGTSGSQFIDINQTGAAYIRIRYVASSGTGTLDVYISGKAV